MKTSEPEKSTQFETPEWAKNASIYEINIRLFTPEGTFRAAEEHLERIKELGIDILWLMPIHEIGSKNRKGTLGSPYSVKDYYSVNPEFGTIENLKQFLKKAHELGFNVILDWVANHTAWNHGWVEEHPEWYARNWNGDFRPTPWWDWSDIIELDYENQGLREAMTKAMLYWVKEIGFDGFRCDVAGLVPLDFWENVRKELEKIKQVFMLAEWESRDVHAKAFDMSYAWSWWEAVNKIAKGESNLGGLYKYYSWNERAFPKASIRMTFLENHDINAWEGSMFDLFEDALEPAIVLSVAGEGMPLIYNGQEAGNTKKLSFFEKDAIEWKQHPVGELYKKLLSLKKENSALWNGKWGSTMIKILNNSDDRVLSFVRQNEKDKVFTVINFSGKKLSLNFDESLCFGSYSEFFSNKNITIEAFTRLEIEPWAYKIFVKER